MKKLLNRIETSSSTSNSIQLPSSPLNNGNGGGGGNSGAGGPGGGGLGSNISGSGNVNSSSSSGGGNNILGKTISLKKIHNISVEEIIAEGGFGIVYLAKANSVKYALKRIVVNNDVDLNVVTREIQIMTTLSHPNLLPCIDFTITSLGNSVTEALLLMPFYKSTLLNLLNARMSAKSHLAESEVLLILLDVVCAIARLHHCTTPIIHRDIKIENVLIDESSSSSASSSPTISSGSSSSTSTSGANERHGPKYILCDFGSATAKIWDSSVHSVTSIQDDLEKYTTLAYRAPEMVDLYSNRGTLNTKIDIWALGIFTYKTCFYTTPFGDSILAIQSANLTFPSTSTYSQQLHALISYLLTPDSATRPDIYQVGEAISILLKIKNPIQNLNGSPPPPSYDILINNMTTKKCNTNNDAVIINKAAATPIVPLETSVTPRQRPKGTTILQAPANGNILIIPPPKSPCKLTPDPPPPTPSSTSSVASNNDNNSSENKHHRRNVSDSSAFEKGGQSQPTPELSSTSSEQALSSWNPFEEHLTATSSGTITTTTMGGGPGSGQGTDSTVTSNPNAGAPVVGGEDDDPFENAPFEFFNYQPIELLSQDDDDESTTTSTSTSTARFDNSSPVDLFGAAPFSNPFLQFSSLGNGSSRNNNPSSTGTNNHIINNQAQFQNQQTTNQTQQQPKRIKPKFGVTNLSYED